MTDGSLRCWTCRHICKLALRAPYRLLLRGGKAAAAAGAASCRGCVMSCQSVAVSGLSMAAVGNGAAAATAATGRVSAPHAKAMRAKPRGPARTRIFASLAQLAAKRFGVELGPRIAIVPPLRSIRLTIPVNVMEYIACAGAFRTLRSSTVRSNIRAAHPLTPNSGPQTLRAAVDGKRRNATHGPRRCGSARTLSAAQLALPQLIGIEPNLQCEEATQDVRSVCAQRVLRTDCSCPDVAAQFGTGAFCASDTKPCSSGSRMKPASRVLRADAVTFFT